MITAGRMKTDGFTLLELLVGLTLLGLVGVAVYGIHGETQHALSPGERRADRRNGSTSEVPLTRTPQDDGSDGAVTGKLSDGICNRGLDSLPPTALTGLTAIPAGGTSTLRRRRNPERSEVAP